MLTSGEGIFYAPYERTHRGLPVFGGDFVVVTDQAGKVLATSVAQTQPISLPSVNAPVSSATALATAEDTLDQTTKTTSPDKIVYALDTPRLAWKVEVAGQDAGDKAAQEVYLDAKSGKVLATDDLILHGTGDGAINGPDPLPLRTTQSGSTYSMTDPDIPGLRCGDTATIQPFTGPDDVWGNGIATSKETGCVDGLYAVQTMDSMLTDWLGRNSFKGDGTSWPLYVGLDDNNAFYCHGQIDCGGRNEVWLGHNPSGGWVSSLDVTGHEFGHGVDDYTPSGISRNGTQEFVGDVLGTLTEHYDNQTSAYDPPDYLIGEEVNLVGSGEIRNMRQPSLEGHPNCYSSSIPTTPVHTAAGPGDHWFYLLAEGSSNSPTCNSSTVTGIGIQKAGKIFYNAMLMKTTASSYLRYRTWTLTAAKNLYPGSCVEFNAVKAAWDAVSVPAQTGDPTCSGTPGAVAVTNPGNKTGTVGTAISSVTLAASGGTSPYTWTATGLPTGLSASAAGVISGTPAAAGTFNVTVTARDSASTPQTGTATFTWTISGGGGGGSQLLLNQGFESGAVNWTGTSGPITNNSGRPARTGTWKLWLGGNGATTTETISQSVSIPASAASATLTFWVRIDSAETTTTRVYDTARVQVVNGSTTTTLATYSNLNKNPTYVQKTFDLSAYKGRTVSVRFLMNEDSSLQTSFVVDDTALTVN